ncbi:hypothetical protein Scep_028114 [Stephania cephalantha]|uniref:Uncharacterized protein n=1 Tax=Stephania cephalantha TaxID=152367 RepID=A0AAP0ECH9_9MAGN
MEGKKWNEKKKYHHDSIKVAIRNNIDRRRHCINEINRNGDTAQMFKNRCVTSVRVVRHLSKKAMSNRLTWSWKLLTIPLRFGNTESAMKAQHALHGRWFAGKMITATYKYTAHHPPTGPVVLGRLLTPETVDTSFRTLTRHIEVHRSSSTGRSGVVRAYKYHIVSKLIVLIHSYLLKVREDSDTFTKNGTPIGVKKDRRKEVIAIGIVALVFGESGTNRTSKSFALPYHFQNLSNHFRPARPTLIGNMMRTLADG